MKRINTLVTLPSRKFNALTLGLMGAILAAVPARADDIDTAITAAGTALTAKGTSLGGTLVTIAVAFTIGLVVARYIRRA